MSSDSEEDIFSASPTKACPAAMAVDEGVSRKRRHCAAGKEAGSSASAEPMPDFLRQMIRAQEKKKAVEDRVQQQAKNDAWNIHALENHEEVAANAQNILQELKECANSAFDGEGDECYTPFFLYAPPLQPVNELMNYGTASSAVELRERVRDLRVGRGRTAAPLKDQGAELAALAIFHEVPLVRKECCETLIANLKSDAGAWASLQSTLVCALCDLGFPAEELDDLRSHLQTPVSFVRYKADARVMLSVDERQTWCRGRIVRPALPHKAGRGQRFVVQLDDSGTMCEDLIELELPSRRLRPAESVEDGEASDSEDESDGDGEVQSATLPPAVVLHLYPLLRLLHPMLQSGVARDAAATRAWFRVLLRLLLHTSNHRHPPKLSAALVGDLVMTGNLSAPGAGSLADAAAECIEALLASIPNERWPLLRKHLSGLACSLNCSPERAQREHVESLLLSALRRRWPITPRAGELRLEIVETKLRALLAHDGRPCDAAMSDEMQIEVEQQQHPEVEHARMTVHELRELVSRMSFVAPATGEGVGVDRRKLSVRVDGKTVCSSSHEFARMLQYMRIVLQKFVECAQSDAQSNQTSQSLKQIKQEIYTWYDHKLMKGMVNCRVVIQETLEQLSVVR